MSDANDDVGQAMAIVLGRKRQRQQQASGVFGGLSVDRARGAGMIP